MREYSPMREMYLGRSNRGYGKGLKEGAEKWGNGAQKGKEIVEIPGGQKESQSKDRAEKEKKSLSLDLYILHIFIRYS